MPPPTDASWSWNAATPRAAAAGRSTTTIPRSPTSPGTRRDRRGTPAPIAQRGLTAARSPGSPRSSSTRRPPARRAARAIPRASSTAARPRAARPEPRNAAVRDPAARHPRCRTGAVPRRYRQARASRAAIAAVPPAAAVVAA
jgi:hypothetical protein